MGIPNSYSTQLPDRCHDLLMLLLPIVQADKRTAARHRGALTTTLTLALATPMLTVPIERIQKYLGQDEGYADERFMSPELAQKIEVAIQGKKLQDHPIFSELGWCFLQQVPPFNVAHGLPNKHAEALSSQAAREAALDLTFETFWNCIRNGLSHGGVVYLDERGRTSVGEASMLCFVSARQDRTTPHCDNRHGRRCPTVVPKIRDLRLLRISESDFLEFLGRWVEWLVQSELASIAAE